MNTEKFFIFSLVSLLTYMADAHVTVDSSSSKAGMYAKLVFRVPHGCEGSPTTKITVQISEGSLSVKPQVHYGWKISMKKVLLTKPVILHGKEITESISEVTWQGGPLLDEHMDEFGISLKLPERAGEEIAFPVIQKCKKGENHWVEVGSSEHSKHGKSMPAPAIKLTK